jgi:hypothetical protein
VEVVWFSRIFSGWGIFRSSRCFINGYSFFHVSGTDVVFLTRSAFNKARQAQGAAAAVVRHRHSLELEDERHLKNFFLSHKSHVISVPLAVLFNFGVAYV